MEPERITTKNIIQTLSVLSGIINRLVQKECVQTSSITIVSDLEYSKSAFSTEEKIGPYKINYSDRNIKEGEIRFRTVSQFKGLESDIIIYLISPTHKMIDVKAQKKEDYVAITRARYYLYVVKQEG